MRRCGQGSVLLVDRTAGAPEGKLQGESTGYRLIAVERRYQSCGKWYAHGAGPMPWAPPRSCGSDKPGIVRVTETQEPAGRRCPTNAGERWE